VLTTLKEYYAPDSGKDVVKLLKKFGDRALILAGGSFVHGLAARDLLSNIEVLIDIQKLGMNAIKSGKRAIKIGAMTRLGDLEQFPEVQSSAALGAVKDALRYPPVQIRNVGTVGGNIAAACPYFDLSTAMMALGASVKAQGAKATREIELDEFFAGMFENTLKSTEFVTEILVPTAGPGCASAFLKLETNANDLAIVNAGVLVEIEDGICTTARVVLGGGVAETPVRSPTAEGELRGQRLGASVLAEAADAVEADIDPMSDHRASAKYRKAMAKVLTRRALEQALKRLN
jgi:CO/xanthine dehydrogenase FAD-binding subunit